MTKRDAALAETATGSPPVQYSSVTDLEEQHGHRALLQDRCLPASLAALPPLVLLAQTHPFPILAPRPFASCVRPSESPSIPFTLLIFHLFSLSQSRSPPLLPLPHVPRKRQTQNGRVVRAVAVLRCRRCVHLEAAPHTSCLSPLLQQRPLEGVEPR
ncbi:hypothetical protein DFH06DRAFT_1338232 [Mycena polygramma]|nr:hypothetical protein DFH06DRAFT_1338232 [Mycena polygramma]